MGRESHRYAHREKKSDKADVSFAIPEIQFRSRRHKKRERDRVNFIIEHHQPVPFSAEKKFWRSGFHGRHNCLQIAALRKERLNLVLQKAMNWPFWILKAVNYCSGGENCWFRAEKFCSG
jgi:hypothetical protein